MAGPTIAIGIAGGIQVLSSTDGHPISTIASPAFEISPNSTVFDEADRWQLASDGSYIAIETQTGLYVYTPGGQLIFSRPGNYMQSDPFAAPGQVEIVNGPAGGFTAETVSVPGGDSNVAPIAGAFYGWFTDGAHFLTSVASTGGGDGIIYVYSSSGVQNGAFQFPAAQMGGTFGGTGNWLWSFGPESVMNMQQYVLYTYALDGTTQGTPLYNLVNAPQASGSTLSFLTSSNQPFNVMDLSGATPTQTSYPLPQL